MADRDHYRSLVHPLIAVGLPVAFLVPLVSLAADVSRGLLPGLLPGPFALSLTVLATGFTAVLSGNIEQDERAAAFARLRELLVLLIAVHLGYSVLRPGPFLSRFSPSVFSIGPLLVAASQWLLTKMFQDALRAREFFLEAIEGKRGPALQNTIRDEAESAADALQGLARLRRFAFAFAFILSVVWIIALLLGARIAPFTVLSAFPCFFLLPFVNALTSQYRIEHYLAGEGLAGTEALRALRIRFSLILLAIAILTALLAGSDHPLLPPRLIADFFAWLSGLFKGTAHEPQPIRYPPPSGPGMADLLRALEAEQQKTPPIDLTRFFAFLRIAAIVAVAAGAIWFIVSPLLSPSFREAVRKRSFLAFMRKKITQLARFFRFRRIEREKPMLMNADDLREVRRSLEEIAARRRGKDKKREIGAMTKLFIRLIEWGASRSFAYGPTSSPLEYVLALSRSVPERAVDLSFAGETFEEALYSDRPIGAGAEGAYREAIKRITSYADPRD